MQIQACGIQVDMTPSPWVIIFHPVHMPSDKQVITSDLHIINITPRKGFVRAPGWECRARAHVLFMRISKSRGWRNQHIFNLSHLLTLIRQGLTMLCVCRSWETPLTQSLSRSEKACRPSIDYLRGLLSRGSLSFYFLFIPSFFLLFP